MKKLYPRLSLEPCNEAVTFYQTVLGGEIKNVKLSNGVPGFEGQEGKYIHAELHLENGDHIYFNDVFGSTPQQGSFLELGLDLDNLEEIERIFNSLSQNGQVKMALQDMFWGARYGKLTDQYGVTWELNFQKN